MMTNKYTKDQLTEYSKDTLIQLFLAQQDTMAKQINQLQKNMEIMIEALHISDQKQYGTATEKIELPEQLCWCFNEAEVTIENKYVIEPEITQVVKEHTRKKSIGKRDEDLSGFPNRVEEHKLDEETLNKLFPNGYKQLPDEVYKKLVMYPATFEVVEHHIFVYCDKKEDRIIRADRPPEIIKNSIATEPLIAAILNAKYINSIPLYRLEQEFLRNDVIISRQVMANWVIKVAELYFSLLYDRIKHEMLCRSNILHADETPVKVIKDGREGNHVNYMWVYRTGKSAGCSPAILYEYQKTRHSDHPKEFLKNFKGTVVCDGYQAYHKLGDERPEELKIAGCWAHARRKFANVCKALGKKATTGTYAEIALSQIAMIYHADNELKELSLLEKQNRRQLQVKPLVDAFFAWVRDTIPRVAENSETGKGLAYCLNQEKYLKTFLDNPIVPLDNNDAEIAIRSFCVGKHNWHIIDTVEGAKASAIIYSVAETAKANNLKPYEYFKYVLTEIPKHMNETKLDFLDPLLPWSPALPDICKKSK